MKRITKYLANDMYLKVIKLSLKDLIDNAASFILY